MKRGLLVVALVVLIAATLLLVGNVAAVFVALGSLSGYRWGFTRGQLTAVRGHSTEVKSMLTRWREEQRP